MAIQNGRHPRPIRSGNNSTIGEKIAEKIHAGVSNLFNKKAAATLVGLVAAIVVTVGGILWYSKNYNNPERVFWGMVDNNLSTYGVTKEITQKSDSTNSNDLTQLTFTSQPRIRNLKQITTNSAEGAGHISIESIGTPKDTYQRYVLIDQPAPPGESKPDYSKVYPMWLRNAGNLQSSSQLFSDSVFGAVLFGNLPTAAREKTVTHLREAYKVDFKNVKKEKKDGRNVYTYNVKVALPDYAKAALFYAKSLKLPNASQIDPNNYQASDELAVSISVDSLSRQIKRIEYKDSSTTEEYSGHGVLATVTVPSRTVDFPTIQKAINEASTPKK